MMESPIAATMSMSAGVRRCTGEERGKGGREGEGEEERGERGGEGRGRGHGREGRVRAGKEGAVGTRKKPSREVMLCRTCRKDTQLKCVNLSHTRPNP